MTKHNPSDPFALLLDFEQRTRLNAKGLPQQAATKNVYSGIGFRLGKDQLLAPMGEVVEILTYPTIVRVPGVKPWVKGLANIRGNLLPVMDLQGFLCGKMTALTQTSRVLSINHNGVVAGLVIDEVLGMKHFFEENVSSKMPDLDKMIKSYLVSAYDDGSQCWGVFSFHKLTESTQFLQAAA